MILEPFWSTFPVVAGAPALVGFLGPFDLSFLL